VLFTSSSGYLNKAKKRVGAVAQVVEYLSSMCDALGSIPSTARKKEIILILRTYFKIKDRSVKEIILRGGH
jgi:hypothetical protein